MKIALQIKVKLTCIVASRHGIIGLISKSIVTRRWRSGWDYRSRCCLRHMCCITLVIMLHLINFISSHLLNLDDLIVITCVQQVLLIELSFSSQTILINGSTLKDETFFYAFSLRVCHLLIMAVLAAVATHVRLPSDIITASTRVH